MPRLIVRAIFTGMGLAFLLVVVLLFILEPDARTAVRDHDWANRIFRELVRGVSLWFSAAVALLVAARFIKGAKAWGLLGLILFDVLVTYAVWDRSYGMIVALPLCLTLICLVIEEYRTVLKPRRETA